MSVLVTDAGFTADDWDRGFADLADGVTAGGTAAIDLASDTDPAVLDSLIRAAMIRVDFPSFADGRGFTLATRLRQRGYTGR